MQATDPCVPLETQNWLLEKARPTNDLCKMRIE